MARKTKRIGRRTLAILLVMIMAFSLLQIGTLAAEMNCGLTEHSHSEACYTVIEHEHGDEASDCYSDHVHDRFCDAVRHVHSTETCAYETHSHSESCYRAHEHSFGCYGLICELEEGRGRDGHRHGPDCYGITCELGDTDELVCGYEENEIIYNCAVRYEYPNCPARDFTCTLQEGENEVLTCGLTEHSHSSACYPRSTYTFDHIDIRVKASDYHLVLGEDSYDLTIAFSANAADTFSVTVPAGGKSDDGKTHIVSPSGYQNQEGEFRLMELKLSDYHKASEFRISGTVLVLKSQVDALPELLRAEFENLPTATYSADEVYSASNNDGGEYYRLTLNNYVPSTNVCIGFGNSKGYDFNITPEAILTPVTDFVVVSKVVVNEAGEVIDDTQDFSFTLGNLSGSIGNPISLAGGESDSFTGLASGLYTVTEAPTDGYKPVAYNGSSWDDALYVQEVQSVSKVDGTAGSVTFYNMKLVDKGSLKISKSVTGTAAAGYSGSYSFTVTDFQGETVASFSLANGESKEIILPAGSYAITETGAAANGTDTLTVYANKDALEADSSGYTTDIDVVKGETAYMSFVNSYDAYVEPPVDPPTPPVPETEEWTIIHNYYVNSTELEGSSSSTVEVEAGQQPDYERVYEYNGAIYEAWGDVEIDTEIRTITLDYNREQAGPSAPPTLELYPVSYEYTGEVPALAPVAPETVEYEEGVEVIVAEDPTLEGYTFSGWDRENFTMPAEAVVIRGEWTVIEQPPVNPDPPAPATYPVSYEYTGNIPENAPAVPATVEYEAGAAVTVAAAPVLEGYTFSGWDKGDFEMPAEAVVIRGEWTVIEQPPVNPDPPAPPAPPVNPPYVPPYIPPVEPPAPPVIDIPDEETPLVDLPDEETPLEELPDEDVPLADVPKTGDTIGLYIVLTVLSAFGLAALSFSGRKLRRNK